MRPCQDGLANGTGPAMWFMSYVKCFVKSETSFHGIKMQLEDILRAKAVSFAIFEFARLQESSETE